MASWDGGIDGGNAAWTISREGDAGYGRAAFLSSIGECGVCCDGVKLGEGARRDSYLFLRILEDSEDLFTDARGYAKNGKQMFYEDFCTRRHRNSCQIDKFEISCQIDKLSI